MRRSSKNDVCEKGNMLRNKLVLACCCAVLIGLGGCSRQQSDWQKTREANTAEAYEQFVKKYPSGEFTAQAQARLKELEEERDWQKARDADTLDAYQAFLKDHPEGKWTEEARIRVENFTLAQTPAGASSPQAAPGPGAGATGAAGAPSGAEPGGAPSHAPGPSMYGASPPSAPSRGASAAAPATADESAAPRAAAKATKAHPPGAHAAMTAPSSGRYAVQLGAFKSGSAAANERWEHLQKEYPKLFAGLSSKVVAKKTASGTLYRLQAVGISEIHARHICKDLKAKSQPCVIVRPTRT
jgi:cell division protein FtsN